MPIAQRVLVIDDEAAVRTVLERVLQREGFQVFSLNTGEGAVEACRRDHPDLVILDLYLPGHPGEKVCQEIREDETVKAVPILILTGRNTEGLTARCLNLGADDYLAKPFNVDELVARIRAVLRRPRIYAADNILVRSGRVSVHSGEHRVMVDDRPIGRFTPKEFHLLRELLIHSPNVLMKNDLALKIWGVSADQLHRRTLDVHVRRIRQKLGFPLAECLKTVPAVGFQWQNRDGRAD